MFKTTINFPSGNQLEILEYETGHYSYKYRQKIDGVLCFRRRWEWHKDLKEKAHIHDHDPLGFARKIFFSRRHTLMKVLKEIKKEFEPEIEVNHYVNVVKDRKEG